MRYMLLDEILLFDLDRYYAFEIEMISSEKGYCISCWDTDQKTIFKVIPGNKASRDMCILVIKEIARIKVLDVPNDKPIVVSTSISNLLKAGAGVPF